MDGNTLAGSQAASTMEKETPAATDGKPASVASDLKYEDETVVKLGPMFPADVTELQKIQTNDPSFEYPTGMRLALTVLALCLSVFLVALVSACPESW